MKKITAIILTTVLVLINSLGVFAANTSVVASLDASDGKITLSGSANGATTIVVRKDGVLPSSFSDGNLPTDMDQFAAGGAYTHEFYLKDLTPYGKYYIKITDSQGSAETSIIYYNKLVADGILQTILSGNNFVADVKSDASALGIDTSDVDFNDGVLQLMKRMYKNYADSVDFNNKYNFCKAVFSLNGKDAAGIEAMLQKYAGVLEINFESDYKENSFLTDADRVRLCSLLSKMDYAATYEAAKAVTGISNGFAANLRSLGAVAVVNGAQSWEELKRIYTEKYSFLKNNVVDNNSEYKNVSSTNTFIELKKLTFDSADDLKNNFTLAVKNAKVSENSNQGNKNYGNSPGVGGGNIVVSTPQAGAFDELPTQTADGGEAVLSPVASVPVLNGTGSVSFPDVAGDVWYAAPVLTLSSSGIINGDEKGNFRPLDNITRAEFAKLVAEAFKIEGGKAENFNDVSTDAWYAPYVMRASATGIITGYEGNFNPNQNISRQDAAVILYRVTKILDVNYIGMEKPADYETASMYAWTAIASFYKHGIINGDQNGNFNPTLSITRAESAQLIYNLINDLASKAK